MIDGQIGQILATFAKFEFSRFYFAFIYFLCVYQKRALSSILVWKFWESLIAHIVSNIEWSTRL